MSFVIRCTCGHQFTRATICQKNLRTWECPRQKAWRMRNPKLANSDYLATASANHQTRGAFR